MSPCTAFLYTRTKFSSRIASSVFSYRCLIACFRPSADSASSLTSGSSVSALTCGSSSSSLMSPASLSRFGRKVPPACARACRFEEGAHSLILTRT